MPDDLQPKVPCGLESRNVQITGEDILRIIFEFFYVLNIFFFLHHDSIRNELDRTNQVKLTSVFLAIDKK